MNYVLTVQVGHFEAYPSPDGEEYAPKNDLEKAFVLDGFDIAKKKFRQTIVEMVRECQFFPFADGKYTPLDDFYKCDDQAPGADDAGMIVLEELSKCLSNPEHFGQFPEETWGFEDHTFISVQDEIYYNIDGAILHFNALSMTDPQKTYFFDYKEMYDYEPEHFISIFMKPVDEQ